MTRRKTDSGQARMTKKEKKKPCYNSLMNKFHPAYEKVYTLVRKIPKGKVTTYGEIARVLHMSPRFVGTALHHNPDANLTPCHRVVNRDGRVAPHFAFGGQDIQRKLLESEGVEFKTETNVELKSSLYTFQK